MFSIFRKIVSALSSKGESVGCVESEMQGFSKYFQASLSLADLRVSYGFPIVTDMTKYGLDVCRAIFMPDDPSTDRLYALIGRHRFDICLGRVSSFDILRNSVGETLFVGRYAESRGRVFVLITDSGNFLEHLCESRMSPVPPWIVFPEVDPGELGRMEGEMGCWWENHWLPFWTTLNDEERRGYLEQKEAPTGWVEFFKSYVELNHLNC